MAPVTATGKEFATAPQHRQQQGPALSSSAAPGDGAPSVEDELRKKNTDCVYFLASPLTCKKGSECEYRHSEYARMNPTDCYYWLNSVCKNPKCGFRHPPLEGLLGPQAAAGPAGLSAPSPRLQQPAPLSAYNPVKQPVPCLFFQQGYCMKGDRCPFLHGPNLIPNPNRNPSGGKVTHPPTAAGVTEPASFKRPFGGLERCSQQKMVPQANAAKLVDTRNVPRTSAKTSSAYAVNGMHPDKRGLTSNGYIEERPRFRVPTAINNNGLLTSRSSVVHHSVSVDDQSFQNSKDADEALRESSPGFDVLVDDEHGDTEYYQNEDQFTGHGGRDGDDFEFGQPGFLNPASDSDHERLLDRHGGDSYDRRQQIHGYEHSRASSERSIREPSQYDRRGSSRTETIGRMRESDLRNRLKQRRGSSLRSVVSPDYAPADRNKDRSYRDARRDSHRLPPLENSHGGRLQGRLRIPRSSPTDGNGVYADREIGRGRNWGRVSPSKPVLQHSRLRDRLGRRIQDDTPEDKSFRGPRMGGDIGDDHGTKFNGLRSLVELKNPKQTDERGPEQQMKPDLSTTAGKRKFPDSSQQAEEDLSFAGPKPLSEILKRKRGAGASASKHVDEREEKQSTEHVFANKEEHKQTPTSVSSASNQESGMRAHGNKRQNNPVMVSETKDEHPYSDKKLKPTAAGTSEVNNPSVHETEEGEGEEEYQGEKGEYEYEEVEGDEGEEGEYEYEEGDGEGYGGENAEGEGDYMEEDDRDDFAKKIGVVLS